MNIWIKQQNDEGVFMVNGIKYICKSNLSDIVHNVAYAISDDMNEEKSIPQLINYHKLFAVDSQGEGHEIGEYKTKERALEVLQEIWNYAAHSQKVFISPGVLQSEECEDCDMLVLPDAGATIKNVSYDIFYEMPKE